MLVVATFEDGRTVDIELRAAYRTQARKGLSTDPGGEASDGIGATALGENTRAAGDGAFAAGKNVQAYGVVSMTVIQQAIHIKTQ